MKYFKYTLMPVLIIMFILTLYFDNYYLFYYLIFVDVLIIGGDYLLPKDKKIHSYKYEFFLEAILHIHLPLLMTFLFVLATNVNNISSYTEAAGVIFLSGLFIASGGTVVAHELVHRTKNKFSIWAGNWLLAISWDNAFAIEHVHGHHKKVGLDSDPATAKRGQFIYSFILSSTLGQIKNAKSIEKNRIAKRNLSWYNNRFYHGLFRNWFVLGLVYYLGGIMAIAIYLFSVLWAKILLETVNYIEHYGLVRAEGGPILPRHSWNSNHMISSIILYNLTRHSDHHEKAYLEFYRLKPYPDAPEMRYGYLTMIYLALLCPFIYNRIMEKELKKWDENFASDKELILIKG